MCIRDSPYEKGIAMLEESAQVRAWNARAKQLAAPIVEAGGVTPELQASCDEVNALCERMNEEVYRTTREWLAKGKRVGVLGGDHSVPFGSIRAHAEKYPGLGLLHLDAHADLRDAYEGFEWSHASIMHNVATRLPDVGRIVQFGIRDFCEEEFDFIQQSAGRLRTFYDAQCKAQQLDGRTWTRIVDEAVAELPQQVFISFDIDGLDPVLCPHTGTPVPGGLSFAEANALIAAVVRSGRTIVGFDLNEVAPGPEGDEWDGNVGARLLYKLIGWTLKSQQRA